MRDEVLSDFPADDPRLGALRIRIVWLCHAVRVAAVGWFLWTLTAWAMIASEPAVQIRRVAHKFDVDPATISILSFRSAIGVAILGVVSSLPLVYFIWRLTRAFLAGRIVTMESALLLRNVGIAGLAATLAGSVTRSLSAAILSTEILTNFRFYDWVKPDDLLYLLISAFVFALGAILKTAAEIADDNRQIV